MALPRLDYQQPDYLGQIGQGVDTAAKVAHGLTPAHPLVQKYLRMAFNGQMDPREAAIMAKLEAGGHIGGDATSAPPTQLAGGQTTFSGPQPGAPMGKVNAPSPTPASQPAAGGSASAPQPGGEYSEDITVTAPRQSPAADLSAFASEPPDNTPILNKDVPQLMQAAGQVQKHNPMDTYMKLYALGLRGQELQEKYREFEGMAPVRQSMINERDANISNMPFKNQMQQGNLNARWAGVDVARGNLATRQNEGYLRGTNDVAAPVAQIDGLLKSLDAHPEIAPPTGDYRVRREAEIVSQIPVVGKGLGGMMKTVADWELTQQQRDFRRQAALAVANFQHMMVGSQITEGEMALVNMLAGQQLSIDDTIAGLSALRKTMGARLNRYKAGYPEAAGRIPDVNPGDVTQQFQSERDPDTGILPGGPENIQPRQLRGTVTSSFGGQ